ncbi:hypothetical protein [Streptomyces sp. NBC_01304]|uniref:hypothetical protein n=1 Tax=Streptomyces sp. NBC_01304 TaxID=2903818 RepID=UPI002E0EE6A6|nr:hypothetical protein OG430_00125 [Streptomyces sp. NBC_01304]WSJ90872.1 hypothetical protein OG430_47385 [Streptomyces sp. NBC_01304]
MTISTRARIPTVTCSACRSLTAQPGIALMNQARRHLASHLAAAPLPLHLRICQCREHACAWHRHPTPCSGPLRLMLICSNNGRTWHLADVCRGCAGAIPHAAAVPEPPPRTPTQPSNTPLSPEAADEACEWVEAL